jgi:Uma2 family endonuclease
MSIATSTAASAVGLQAAIPTELVWRLSVAQYQQMVRNGILTEDDPVELLEGWLIPKMPKSPQHRTATRLTRTVLERMIPAGWYVDSQEPITTGDSEPEPDVVIVRGEPGDYAARHPGPANVALVVEVSDTPLQRDRTVKSRLYAAAGLPSYWIVNLVDRRVEMYSSPSGSPAAYQRVQTHNPGDSIAVTIDGATIGHVAVTDLLP